MAPRRDGDISPPPDEKVLVIQPLPGIGDMVWFIPHLRAIAAATPAKKISVLTKSRSFAERLVGHEDFVEEFIWIDHGRARTHPLRSVGEMASALRARRFTRVWIMHHSSRYALAAALAGIRDRAGYGTAGLQRLFLTDKRHLPREARRHSAIERADGLLRLHGISVEDRDLRVDPQALRRIRARFGRLPRPWIGLGIGSSHPRKCWPLDRFAELAGRLNSQGQLTVFLCGAEHDAGAAHDIARSARCRGIAPVAAVDLPLEQSVALVSECGLFIGNDSGLMNIAASLGVGTVGLFGGGVVLDYRDNLHAVVPDGLAAPSMDGISVDAVLGLIERQGLASGAASEAPCSRPND